MPLTLTAERLPLRVMDGAVVVADTRVPIETVVDDFNAGASAEEIALAYPSLALGDIYAVIAYYLHHKSEIDAYLKEQGLLADKARERHGVDEASRRLREELLARRKQASR